LTDRLFGFQLFDFLQLLVHFQIVQNDGNKEAEHNQRDKQVIGHKVDGHKGDHPIVDHPQHFNLQHNAKHIPQFVPQQIQTTNSVHPSWVIIWNMAMNAWGNVWKWCKLGMEQKSWSETAEAMITKVTVNSTKPPNFFPGENIYNIFIQTNKL
jgi:hypothetical protein